MHIKYMPSSKRAQESKVPAPTNIGDFLPGQVAGPYTTPHSIREAKQLVANGEFVQTDPVGVELTDIPTAPKVELTDTTAAPKPRKK
jgi:hypothetical protein